MPDGDVLTETLFWSRVIADSRKTVLCNPEHESRIKAWVEARGMAGIIRVQASVSVPLDRMYIVKDLVEAP